MKYTKFFYLNRNFCLLFIFFALLLIGCRSDEKIYCISSADNDFLFLLKEEGFSLIRYQTIKSAVDSIPKGNVLLCLAKDYPDKIETLDKEDLEKAKQKKLKIYIEYASVGTDTIPAVSSLNLERVVVTDSSFSRNLPLMTLLCVNVSHFIPVEADSSILMLAKVAGFDKAEYGLSDTKTYPLLYHYNENIFVSTIPLSCFASARFSPEYLWKIIWETIFSDLKGKAYTFKSWLSYVTPAYGPYNALPVGARKKSIQKGVNWFFKGHFLVDKSWKSDWVDKYMGDGSMPIGPELPSDLKDGDGSLGILEGHCSFIYHDGTQKYRYWMRGDVQGETAMAFSLAGNLLEKKNFYEIAENLNNFLFDQFRDSTAEGSPSSDSFGLLGWSVTHPYIFYGDDNARSILGSLATAAVLKNDQWDRKILECIVANFRTTGKNGFRGERLEKNDLQKNGWKYYWNSNLINPHPHFEAWMWACYLWLYGKTGYQPLYDRTEKAIRITMDAYPENWKWTNGIQQERARMILPLAWLVRVNPSEEHKKWLDFMVNELLKNQVECGAIREALGDASTGMFGKAKSNAAYGEHEAPLIFNNGDPVSDMLYTNNFAFFALNEAAKATDNPQYLKAVSNLSDFLTRIQLRSDRFQNLDGAWFRAFNYRNWDYWASNADAGWGAWSTLTGWIQSWILATQVFLEKDTSLWDLIESVPVEKDWMSVKRKMLTY